MSKNKPRTLVAATLVLFALLACKKKDPPPPEPAQPPPNPAGQSGGLQSDPSWFVHKPSGVQFMAPVGWRQEKSEDLVVFGAPDKTAVIAIGFYDKNKDPSAFIMTFARRLGLTDLDFKSGNKTGSLNGIPSKSADGKCKITGEDAEYGYAILTPGGPSDVLLIYAARKSASAERKQEAVASFKSIRRSTG